MFAEKLQHLEVGEVAWDRDDKGSVKGLMARRTLTGISLMVYYITRQGKERRPKIGTYPDMDIPTARKIATNIRARVALGEDPKGDWDDQKEMPTLTDFYKSVRPDLLPASSRDSGWADESDRIFRKDVAPYFGGQKMNEIEVSAVRVWHKSLEGRGLFAANRALTVLSLIFSRAERDSVIQWGENPCLRVKRFKEEPRERFATMEEIKAIGALLRKYENDFKLQVAFIRLLIFTGARPSVWERAKWHDIKQKNGGSVLVSKGKSGGDEIILTKEVMDILGTLPMEETDKYILGIFMPTKFWNRIRKEANCEDLWARDWRRAFASVAKDQGVSIEGIADLLGHRTVQTSLIYAKAIEGAKVKNAELASRTMSNLLSPSEIQNHECEHHEEKHPED